MDFHLANYGTIYVLTPETDQARAWVDEYLPSDAMRWGRNGVVVEHRYIADIVEGIRADGMEVQS